MLPSRRPVAVLGGVRVPFARAFTAFAHASNQDLLTAALSGLVDRFDLADERLGEVVAGSVLKHSRDHDLTRESVLGTRLDPRTPAYDLQQACLTGLEATILVADKIELGQIDVGVAGGADTMSDVPLAVSPRLRAALLAVSRSRRVRERLRAVAAVRPRDLRPEPPPDREPRTGLTMHQHAARTALAWGITREEQDAFATGSHRKLATAQDRGFFDDLVVPYLGLGADDNVRRDTSEERLAALPPVTGTDPAAGLTAGNSAPLSDGASAVLLASDAWAESHGLPVLAHLTWRHTAAVDYVHGDEGLLTAPAYAVAAMLSRARLSLADFTLYELNEAYASQVLATLRAWEDPVFCVERLGRDEPLGKLDRNRLNVNGGALAFGHPFAASGGRLVAQVAASLAEEGGGRGLIAMCAAGGLGAAAVLER